MHTPTLYVFSISHYCEKARWALDYLGVPHTVQVVAPGAHQKIAKQLGLKRGSLPFISGESGVIQGSDAIIDWAEPLAKSGRALASNNAQVNIIEKRLDAQLGVHVRRWYYSEAIVEYPASVKPVFTHNLPFWQRLKLTVQWPVIRKLMIDKMDLGPKQGLESFDIVKQEIAWLESLLASNRPNLTGVEFTRADITAASLLAPILNPPQHPCSELISIPPRLNQQFETMSDQAIWPWILNKYSEHRVSGTIRHMA